jgi:hypothetical protein
MRRLLMAVSMLGVMGSGAAHARPGPTDSAPSDCVWPAVGGAAGGVAIAWYGFVGIEAARGRSAFDLETTPANVALVLSLETAGLIGGAAAGCAIWGDEGRWFPTAGSVIAGGVAGGTAVGLGAFAAVTASGLDDDTDAPVVTALILTGAVAAGVVAGGYLGFKLDRALRGAPHLVPIVGDERVGLALAFAL